MLSTNVSSSAQRLVLWQDDATVYFLQQTEKKSAWWLQKIDSILLGVFHHLLPAAFVFMKSNASVPLWRGVAAFDVLNSVRLGV